MRSSVTPPTIRSPTMTGSWVNLPFIILSTASARDASGEMEMTPRVARSPTVNRAPMFLPSIALFFRMSSKALKILRTLS